MIEVFEGRLGGGKTYSATDRILNDVLPKGRQVFTNVRLKWDECCQYVHEKHGVELEADQVVFLEFGQIRRFIDHITRDCLLVLDEAHLWFNARDWSQTDREVLAMLTQSRKINVDCIFISQSANNIDKQFMRLVQYIWRFRDMSTFFILPGVRWPDFIRGITCGIVRGDHICQAQYDYDGKTRLNRFWKIKDPDIFKCYDTNALLSDVKVKEGKGARTLQKVEKKQKMKLLVPLVVLAFLVAVVFGVVKVFGLGQDKPKASESALSNHAKSNKEYFGATYIKTVKGVEFYADKFRTASDGEVITDSYDFREGDESAVGRVVQAGPSGVRVRCFDGVDRIIIRDLTPDKPYVTNGINGTSSSNKPGLSTSDANQRGHL
jgi:Zonular occludens toxin (Zot)